jgi:hypothetical protein
MRGKDALVLPHVTDLSSHRDDEEDDEVDEEDGPEDGDVEEGEQSHHARDGHCPRRCVPTLPRQYLLMFESERRLTRT